MNPNQACERTGDLTLLACDLGGTRLKVGVVRDGQVLARAIAPAHSHEGLRPQLPLLKATWLRLLAELKLTVALVLIVTTLTLKPNGLFGKVLVTRV